MRAKHLIMLAILLTATFGLAACQTSSNVPGAAVSQGDEPGEPGAGGRATEPSAAEKPTEPAAGSGAEQPGGDKPDEPGAGAGDLASAVGGLGGETKYVSLPDIEDACASPNCAAELEAFKAELMADCPTADSCTDEVARVLLHSTPPTSAQRRAGICPSTSCVQVGDVLEKIDETGVGDSTAAGDEPVVDEETAKKIASAISASTAEGLTWDEVKAVVYAACPDCADPLDTLIERVDAELAAGTLTEGAAKTAQDLADGAAAAAADVVALLDEAAGKQ